TGGLVGNHAGDITYSFAHGNVYSLGVDSGGLVGEQSAGSITYSYSTGNVTNDTDTGAVNIGGFVGNNAANIFYSYATGNIYTTGDSAGGFVGQSTGAIEIKYNYSTGNVIGVNDVGGFAGYNTSTIRASYSTGSVLGDTDIGGFAGQSLTQMDTNYSTGTVDGITNVGGFVGQSSGDLLNNYTRSNVIPAGGYAFIGLLSGGTQTTNYWDSDIEDALASPGVLSAAGDYEPKTTTELKTPGSLPGFVFTSDWKIIVGHDFPHPVSNIDKRAKCLDNMTATTYDAIFEASGTKGSQTDPYIICNHNQLEDLANNGCNSSTTTDCDKYFKLGNDIDMTDIVLLEKIGGGGPDCFSGEFDGAGYSIYNYQRNTVFFHVGLFNCVSGTIKNLNFKNSFIAGETNLATIALELNGGKLINSHVEGKLQTTSQSLYNTHGGLVGTATNALIAKSSFNGSLTTGTSSGAISAIADSNTLNFKNKAIATVSAYNDVGGITSTGNSSKSIFIGDITLTNSTGDANLGGIIGSTGSANQCVSKVNLDSNSLNQAGGMGGASVDVTNSYSVNDIVGGDYAGGLVGSSSTISNSYAVSDITGGSNLGGLTGDLLGITDSFFDDTIAFGGTGAKTTAEMLDPATFSTWNTDIWALPTLANKRTPKLKWQLHPICQANMDAIAFSSIGNGTSTDPYLICFKKQLMDIGYSCNDTITTACTAHFVLMNDIDMQNDGAFVPIGDNNTAANNFSGSFNGNNHIISRLYINNALSRQGLFGYSNGANIYDLKVIDSSITAASNRGILAGGFYNGTIKNVFVSGTVTGISGSYVGGLVGFLSSTGKIYNSGAHVTVTAGNVNYVGGLVGSGDSSGSRCYIENSYTTGSVTNTGGASNRTGGFIGWSKCEIINSWTSSNVNGANLSGGFAGAVSSGGSISYSYATGTVIATAGFVSAVNGAGSKVSNSYFTGDITYASGAGFVDSTDGSGVIVEYNYVASPMSGGSTECFIDTAGADTFTENFYDSELPGVVCDATATATGQTTANMKNSATFTGASWDTTNTWIIRGSNYPRLRTEGVK
ncbi:hypothetical protein N9W41_00950, partial [bacterium]|nr:hypothetical protein [bacterium]